MSDILIQKFQDHIKEILKDPTMKAFVFYTPLHGKIYKVAIFDKEEFELKEKEK